MSPFAPPGSRASLRVPWVLLGLAFSSIPVAMPALAYVDPAASSLILQVILGGLAGLGVALRLVWGRIRRAKKPKTGPDVGDPPGAGPSR